MQRRGALAILAGGAAAWPLAARAQQKPTPVIGILGTTTSAIDVVAANLAAFRDGLKETGYIEGQNVHIEYRWAEREAERLPGLAAGLVARKVDVIVTEGGDSSTLAAKNATSTIPIVFHGSSDPVALGLVASFARPGGNLTGVNLLGGELIPKLLELLLEVVPQARLIGLIREPGANVAVTMPAAGTQRAQMHVVDALTPSEADAAFAALSGCRSAASSSSPSIESGSPRQRCASACRPSRSSAISPTPADCSAMDQR
jgi:putative tryptophan/tyrosine transport system substrate-binding protein